MNEKIISVNEVLELFDLFTDLMVDGNIEYEDYLPKFREITGVDEKSPMEFLYRGFIGGLYIASLSDDVVKAVRYEKRLHKSNH